MSFIFLLCIILIDWLTDCAWSILISQLIDFFVDEGVSHVETGIFLISLNLDNVCYVICSGSEKVDN